MKKGLKNFDEITNYLIEKCDFKRKELEKVREEINKIKLKINAKETEKKKAFEENKSDDYLDCDFEIKQNYDLLRFYTDKETEIISGKVLNDDELAEFYEELDNAYDYICASALTELSEDMEKIIKKAKIFRINIEKMTKLNEILKTKVERKLFFKTTKRTPIILDLIEKIASNGEYNIQKNTGVYANGYSAGGTYNGEYNTECTIQVKDAIKKIYDNLI